MKFPIITCKKVPLEHFESHLSCIKGSSNSTRLNPLKRACPISPRSSAPFKYMVAETLAAGSNYLFAKYDSVINDVNESEHRLTENLDQSESSSTSTTSANRILWKWKSFRLSKLPNKIETRRKQISSELTEKTKISSIGDFEKFRHAIQKLGSPFNNKENELLTVYSSYVLNKISFRYNIIFRYRRINTKCTSNNNFNIFDTFS